LLRGKFINILFETQKTLKMTIAKKIPATYADIEALPPNMVGEILFGSLVTHPRPTPRHGVASMNVGALVTQRFGFSNDGPADWVFIVEPELHLGLHIVVPDIAGWRVKNAENLFERAWIETAPDWLCEVLSPSTEKYDRSDKQRIYANYLVDHVWHVNPTTKLLEVYARQDRAWLQTHIFKDQETVSAPPFESLSFNLGLLWPFDQPST
jgi:Uma2 family endonuclease